jgi:FlaA1/EpsC-like NDP-sugar epimerase
MSSILSFIGRNKELFTKNILDNSNKLENIVSQSNFLVIGGAGSIGQAVTKEIFKRNPDKLHIIDICKNKMIGLISNIQNVEYNIFTKYTRNEKDLFTLMHIINIFNTDKILQKTIVIYEEINLKLTKVLIYA